MRQRGRVLLMGVGQPLRGGGPSSRRRDGGGRSKGALTVTLRRYGSAVVGRAALLVEGRDDLERLRYAVSCAVAYVVVVVVEGGKLAQLESCAAAPILKSV